MLPQFNDRGDELACTGFAALFFARVPRNPRAPGEACADVSGHVGQKRKSELIHRHRREGAAAMLLEDFTEVFAYA